MKVYKHDQLPRHSEAAVVCTLVIKAMQVKAMQVTWATQAIADMQFIELVTEAAKGIKSLKDLEAI